MRYAFWRVSWGRPSRGVGVRKARRQSARTAMAHAPIPIIVFVVGIPVRLRVLRVLVLQGQALRCVLRVLGRRAQTFHLGWRGMVLKALMTARQQR